MTRPGFSRSLLLASATYFLAGCGGHNVGVTGKLLKGGVKYTPPEGHRITITLVALEAKDEDGKVVKDEPFQATLKPDGESFWVAGRDGSGVPPGKYRVAVTQRMTREAFEASKPKSPAGKLPITPRDRLPRREVQPGQIADRPRDQGLEPAGDRPGKADRGLTIVGLSPDREPSGLESHLDAPAAAQRVIRGSIGRWNRAETIVRAWNPAINAAVRTVGPSRRRTSGTAMSQPRAASTVRPRWLAR